MKTYQPKKHEINRDWHLIDIKGKVLGRVATEIAKFLMGKHKPSYSAHMDSGDFVVVINAAEVVVTGKKEQQKIYYSHSGFPGGLKKVAYAKLKKENPEKIITKAVYNMIPGNRLRKGRMNRLKVYKDANHKYEDKFVKKDGK